MPQLQLSKDDTRTIRNACPHFRVLIIGRANAGKTTILQKICNTTENPEVRSPRGMKIDLSFLNPTRGRGIHDIEKEMVFPNNPGFIFHDSPGFEAGSAEELERVKDFIAKRAKEKKLKNRLHVIWYCLPTDDSRLLTAAETSFFDKCGTGKVPVIAIFTKFDYGDIAAFCALQKEGMNHHEAKMHAPSRSKADFEKLHLQRVYETKFPPRKHVYLRDMNKPGSHCGDLVEQTADALNDDVLRMVFVTSQRDNLGVYIRHAVTDGVVPFLQNFDNNVLTQNDMEKLVNKVLSWFPMHANYLYMSQIPDLEVAGLF